MHSVDSDLNVCPYAALSYLVLKHSNAIHLASICRLLGFLDPDQLRLAKCKCNIMIVMPATGH